MPQEDILGDGGAIGGGPTHTGLTGFVQFLEACGSKICRLDVDSTQVWTLFYQIYWEYLETSIFVVLKTIQIYYLKIIEICLIPLAKTRKNFDDERAKAG